MITISSQEILERSLYTQLMEVTLGLGLTLNPEDYYPITPESAARFEADLSDLKTEKKTFISIFGVANNQSRGQKETPRITVESEGFYPGDVGMPKQILELQEGLGYTATEFPYEAINQYINIRLVANNQTEMRLLHTILFTAIPQRGYIKPWPSPTFLKEGNIFLDLFNYYNRQDNDYGILEKVYQFVIYDTLLEVREIPDEVIAPINQITLLLDTLNDPDYIGNNEVLIDVKTT